MLRFTAARIAQSIITLIVLSMVVFFGAELTGDIALAMATPDTTEAELEEIRRKFGLDRPAYERYGRYLFNLVQGDLGVSGTSRRQVSEMMAERIPPTLQLAAVGLFLAMVIGIPLGVLAAVKRNTIVDQFAKVFAIIGMSAPQFWVAIMLIMFFGAQLKWLPTYGRGGIDHYILPGIAISSFVMAGFMRLTRSSMLEVLDSEFVKFARIKGLQERLVIFKHALKNAIIPVLTFGGVSFAGTAERRHRGRGGIRVARVGPADAGRHTRTGHGGDYGNHPHLRVHLRVPVHSGGHSLRIRGSSDPVPVTEPGHGSTNGRYQVDVRHRVAGIVFLRRRTDSVDTGYRPAGVLAGLRAIRSLAGALRPAGTGRAQGSAADCAPFEPSENPLGVDLLGRDILSRLIYGARISAFISLISLGFGALVGTALGVASGYLGGKIDAILMRVCDGVMGFPTILLALIIVAIQGGAGIQNVVIAIMATVWARFARQVRGEVLSIKERDFVTLAIVAGVPPHVIMWRHIFPNVVNTVLVIISLLVGQTILLEASLSFLGVGVPPGNRRGASWFPRAGTTCWTCGGCR